MAYRPLLLFLLLFSFTIAGAQNILLLDKQFKNPPQPASEFLTKQFFNNKFPIYTNEIQVVKQNAEALARMLDRFDLKPLQQDTLMAGHSRFIFFNHQNGYTNEMTVILTTRVNNMELNLTLISQEHNKRNAQLKLLGLADYLSTQLLTASR